MPRCAGSGRIPANSILGLEDTVSESLPLFDDGGAGAAARAPSPLAAAAEQLLASDNGLWTAARLRKQWPSKPLPKPAALEAALAELEQRGKASRLPGKGGKPVWSARPLEAWLAAARERMLESVRSSSAPLKQKQLLDACGWPKELDPGPALDLIGRLAGEGLLKRWPGTAPAWWRLGPEEIVGETLLEALGTRALSRAEWLKAAKARLKGVPAARWEAAVEELVSSMRVFRHALRIDGKKVEACARAEHRGAFLELYRPMLDRLREEWRRLGATEEQIARFLSDSPSPAAELLFAELKELERQSRPPNYVGALRKRPALAHLGKKEFDRAALALLREGRVYMAPHDHPLRLPEAEREELVSDNEGNFYVSISARR